MTDFTPFPKIARLNRDITITEKIDGTNAAVVIVPFGSEVPVLQNGDSAIIAYVGAEEPSGLPLWVVLAQSRTRFITPRQDNYGFAGWVQRNAEGLVDTLGEGTHFGEWWGSGVQRKYGLTGPDKRFSLFNAARWNGLLGEPLEWLSEEVPGLSVVPVLYSGPYSEVAIQSTIDRLREEGSVAAPGFRDPEGIVVWHDEARQMFKVTLKGDEAPKGFAAHANDEEKVAA